MGANMNNAIDKVMIPGTLVVSFVSYRDKSKGQFKVAKLDSPIGEFEVKDKWIENLETGEHKGVFWVNEIKIRTYPTRGGGMFISVLVADVPDYQIEDSQEFDSQNSSSVEVEIQDPAVEEAQASKNQTQNKESKKPSTDNDDKADKQSTEAKVTEEVETDKAIMDATQGKYKTISELPDEYNPDQSLPRSVLRAFFERINHNKGGEFKFEKERKLWIRVVNN